MSREEKPSIRERLTQAKEQAAEKVEHRTIDREKVKVKDFMEFFNSAVGVLQTLVVALGAGLGIWGVINLLEGYGHR